MEHSGKALFLDRDGVINIDHGYVYQIDQFQFMPGIFKLCSRFVSAGYQIVVVTNQSGIARNMYSQEDFLSLTCWMKEQFLRHGVAISGVYYCPHHPQFPTSEFDGLCSCRKPAPGMMLQAAEELSLDLTQCVMVGDKISDMQAALDAGIEQNYFLQTDVSDVVIPDKVHVVRDLQQISPD